MRKGLVAFVVLVNAWAGAQDLPKVVGFHEAVYDTAGKLVPWASWDDALALEIEYYLKCPPGGVAAMFCAAGGGEQYKDMAYRNLTWMLYHIDKDGCPAQKASGDKPRRGGWQEDCHTDVLHNFIDALIAVPEWSGKP